MIYPWATKIFVVTCICCLAAASTASAGAESEVHFDAEQIQRILAHGPWPQTIPPDPGNPLSGNARAESFGQQLFADPALSGNGQIACSSCHLATLAFSDGRARAQGTGAHWRNTQGLLNAGLQRWFGWDGGADSLWAAALRPLFNAIEMQADAAHVAGAVRNNPRYAQALRTLQNAVASESMGESAYALTLKPTALATDEHLTVLVAQSIAAWVRTLQSPRTRFDAFRDALANNDAGAMQAYPKAARRGLKIFTGRGRCHLCHYGPNFSNGEFHDIGRPFMIAPGLVDPGRYRGIQRVRGDSFNLLGQYAAKITPQDRAKTETVRLSRERWGQWRTPSLRNLTRTGPYMHDGSVLSLRDVVRYYVAIDPERLHTNGEAILQPLNLSEHDIDDLVAFLESLSVQ